MYLSVMSSYDQFRAAMTTEAYAVMIGVWLRQARLYRSITQTALAKRSGLSSTCIAMIERGERIPSAMTVIKLRKAMGFKTVDLFADR